MLEEIETFNSLGEAQIVIAFLQANDIDASLADANTMSVMIGAMSISQYRVLAPRDQAADAKRLLGEIAAGSTESDEG